ncbi:MAG: hypothetical protein IJE68_01280 [Clostridia bacterium]|nr:hypothetical protein [Clostridia bacterium]
MKKIKLKVDSTDYKIIINALVEFRNKLISEKRDTTPIDDILLNLVDKL